MRIGRVVMLYNPRMSVIVVKRRYLLIVRVQACSSGSNFSREVSRDSCRGVMTIKVDDKSRRPGRHQTLIVEV
jgi:hypothetical protein